MQAATQGTQGAVEVEEMMPFWKILCAAVVAAAAAAAAAAGVESVLAADAWVPLQARRN